MAMQIRKKENSYNQAMHYKTFILACGCVALLALAILAGYTALHGSYFVAGLYVAATVGLVVVLAHYYDERL